MLARTLKATTHRALPVARLPRDDRSRATQTQLEPKDHQVLIATSAAVSKDIGLLATFLGIGVIVNLVVVFIAIQVRGERHQNQQRH